MKTILIQLPLLFILSSFFCIQLYAQNEKSIFDLERGIFIDPNSESYAQPQVNKVEEKLIANLNKAGFPCDCKTDFFTVNTSGNIQQWSKVNNTITGGNVILTGGHRGGLAYCGEGTSRTFYCANYPDNSYRYYDTTANAWNTVTTPFSSALNNGGYRQHQYYMEGTTTLHYYNGYTFTVVPVPSTFQMTVYDIAVDSLGRAWVFSGPSFGSTSHLNVIDSTGIKITYDFNFNTIGTYGTFFLDGELYLARGTQGDVVPLSITGTTAQAGTPIFFPNSQFADVGSCQCLYTPPPPCPDLSPVTYLLPNTTSGLSVIEFAVRVSEVGNVSTDGSPITIRIPSDSRLLFVWSIGLTSAAFIPVQNSDWNYLGDNGLLHTWTYNGPGLVIPSGTSSAFGFQAFYDPQSTEGNTSISATIVPFSGGECNILNNVDAEKLVYFD